MEPANMRHTKYLVCVDGSAESHVALKLACLRVRRRKGSSVDLLHVISPIDFQTLHAIQDRMQEEKRAEAETLMQRFAQEAQQLSGVMPTIVLREGKPAVEILAAASEDKDVNMLVLGVSEKSGTRGSTLSWLTAQVGKKLSVPLLLVPGNLSDQQIEDLG